MLEIRRVAETPMRGRDHVFISIEQCAHLIRRPDIELSLLVLTVGVEARIKAFFRRAHLLEKPADDARCRAGEAFRACCPPRVGVKRE